MTFLLKLKGFNLITYIHLSVTGKYFWYDIMIGCSDIATGVSHRQQ
jgi:hypothetical protein